MLQILEDGVQTYRYLTHSHSKNIILNNYWFFFGSYQHIIHMFEVLCVLWQCMVCRDFVNCCYHMHLTMQLFNDFQQNISSYHSFYCVIIQISWSRSLHRWWRVWNSLVIHSITRWLQTYRWALSGQWARHIIDHYRVGATSHIATILAPFFCLVIPTGNTRSASFTTTE